MLAFSEKYPLPFRYWSYLLVLYCTVLYCNFHTAKQIIYHSVVCVLFSILFQLFNEFFAFIGIMAVNKMMVSRYLC